jgi:hypothetical protein
VFVRIWQDGQTTPSPLPGWLEARKSADWLFPIHGGTGYAVGGTCAGVEVLSTAGRTCGCVAVPGLSALSTIGRDGSLIVPRTDHYDVYSHLFQ